MVQRLHAHLIFYCLIFLSLSVFISCNHSGNNTVSEKPADNRFTKIVVAQGFDEPMAMTFTDDGRVLIVERKGTLKSVNTKTHQVRTIARIPVNTKYTSKDGTVSEAEEGLVGIVVHPDFHKNHWIYMYYADPKDTKHVLARWELHGDSLYPSSKKVIIEIPTQREVCCHTGGGMVFDMQGNLYLTVGNNTANPASGTASYDERPGRSSWDDQRGSGNTNDLRGKILRIHPEDDGSYTIPTGNLFKPGTPKTRPEIYVMGDRNPWRVSIDTKTGYLYWGEVGPDAAVDSIWGSRGYDEFNQARKAGNFGWPFFIGDNRAYVKYNYSDSTYGEKFDPSRPVNNSPNNTGLTVLPPAQKAFIWYPYSSSDSFPLVGSSGRCAVGGPIYHRANFKNALRPWSEYYEGKWLITDFMRGWIMAVSMNENADYKSMERLLTSENFSSTIDMQFAPDGDLYLLQYGSAWFKGNANSALVCIQYNAGNRKPIAKISAEKTAAAVPFTVKLSSRGSIDYDRYDSGALKSQWNISGDGITKSISGDYAIFTLNNPGIYKATLVVTDTKGEKDYKSLDLIAGNEPPSVSLKILEGNKTFFFPNEPIRYSVDVYDKEDGSTVSGKIQPRSVNVTYDYIPQDLKLKSLKYFDSADVEEGFQAGLYLIRTNDCKSCHIKDSQSIGPSFMAISAKYKNNNNILPTLASKIITGGSGTWGSQAMAAHPNVTFENAQRMVRYILGLSKKQNIQMKQPLTGIIFPKIPEGENGKGRYIIYASYADHGAFAAPTLSSYDLTELKSPFLDPQDADIQKGSQLLTTPTVEFSMVGNDSYLGYKQLDMTGIKQLRFFVQATPSSGDTGGFIEIHSDSPNGKLIGKTDMIDSKEIDFTNLMENNNKTKKGKTDKAKQTTVDFDQIMQLLSIQKTVVLSSESGLHDIYFVFKNGNANSNQPLMQVLEIQFQKKPVAKKGN